MVLPSAITQAVSRLVRSPTGELTRAQKFAGYSLNLARHCARELAGNRASQMAAALTYRTLFSLVPTAILAMLMFRVFIGVEEAQTWFQGTAYSFLGLSAVAVPEEGQAAGAQGPGVQVEAARLEALRETADQHLAEVVNAAWDHLKFGNVGAIGIVLLIWAALALAVTVEQCFNRIYRCPAGRAWHHRIPIYWAVVTLGPLLLFFSLYIAGGLVHWAEDMLDLSVLVRMTGWAAALMASWLLLFLTYVLMPNTRVHLRPALVGSFVAASLWELAKWGFNLYVVKAVGISALYGSLGMIPLFLFWLYLTWLIVLFGLQLTYSLQAMRGQEFQIDELQRHQRHLLGDPRWFIAMMSVVGRDFTAGRPVTSDQVSRQLQIDRRVVADVGAALEEAGLLHCLDAAGHHEGGFVLAMAPDRIRIDTLLDLGRTLAEAKQIPGSTATQELFHRMDEARRDAVSDGSLADLIAPDHRDD